MARGARYGALGPHHAITLHHDHASQLGGDLEAKGPRLTRRDVVVGVRRGSIVRVEDVLDVELRLPPALASILRSVALRTSRGSRRMSSPFSSIRSKAYRNVLSSWRR